jgi:peptide/nickel transport system permease protein
MNIKGMLSVLKNNPKALIGFIILVGFFLMALIGPMVIKLNMTADYINRFQSPSFKHLLGTDYAGRDTLAQIIHGSRDVMLIAFSTACFGTFAAIILGFFAGLTGGWADKTILVVIDIVLTVPGFPVMAIFSALFQINDPISFGLILSLWTWPVLARSLRNQIISLKKKEFVEVCVVMGLSKRHIIFKELLPNLVSFITINFINIAKGAITASVGIMLLGLVPLSVTNWGMMLNMAAKQTGAIYIPSGLAYLLSPIFFIVLFQFGLICFASGIEEIFDPRLR